MYINKRFTSLDEEGYRNLIRRKNEGSLSRRFSSAKEVEKNLENKPHGGLGLATVGLVRSSVRNGANRGIKKYEEGNASRKEAKNIATAEGLGRGALKLGSIVAGAKLLPKVIKDPKNLINRKILLDTGKTAALAAVAGGLIAARGARKRVDETLNNGDSNRLR